MMRAVILCVGLLAAPLASATDGVFCFKNSAAHGFLSDTEHFPSVCSSGEKWLISETRLHVYCIRNNFARTFLGAETAGKNAHVCGPAAQWELTMQDDGNYCVKQQKTGKYLSSAATGFHTDCGTQEKWALVPVLP